MWDNGVKWPLVNYMNPAETIERKCQIRDIKSFDTALPIGWANMAAERTRINPSGHVVWCYDGLAVLTIDQEIPIEFRNLVGYPRAIDDAGDLILGLLAQREF